MSTKGVINFQSKTAAKAPNDFSTTRAKSFRVKTSPGDFAQYVKTIKAYALAGMPFNHIANAGDILGDEVERQEIDTPLQNNWQDKIGELQEDENQILAWQTRGETASINHQLSAPDQSLGREVVIVSNSLTVEQKPQQTIDVLEGIKVLKQDRFSLPDPNSNQELENNPYLKVPPQEIKKSS